MERINELIGIIEGINYDGVINELEAYKLKEWVKMNRSLEFSKDYYQIIEKLDSILKDNYIDDTEKEYLLKLIQQYGSKYNNISESLIALNGIIEGIVCDNLLNDKEIYHLNKWLDNNKELKGIKTYDEIYYIVKEILRDNKITKEEQKILMDLISDSIIDSKTNIKINYLKKLITSKKLVGINLIELLTDKNVVKKIHENAEQQLMKCLQSFTGSAVVDNRIILLSLILIALLEYDGSYYSKVKNTYKNLYRRFSEQKIEGQIRSIISKFRNDDQIDRARIINTVLIHSIVPQKFLADFFEFIYDIYHLNFNYTLHDNLYDEFKFVYQGIRSALSMEDDELSFNVTKKTYKLIRSTKALIMSEQDFDHIIQLSINVVELIDKIYWGEKDADIINPYYRKGYFDWIGKYYNNRILKNDGSRKKDELKSRWKPTFELRGNKIYLIPPVHRIGNFYNYSTVKVVVSNNQGNIFVDTKPSIKEIFGGYQIEPREILIDNPLSNINYKVYANNNVIYDSKNELYRDLIIFNQNGKEIKNNTNYHGIAYMCFKECKNHIDVHYKNSFYKLGNKQVDENTILMFGETVFGFSSAIEPGITGEPYNNVYLYNNDIKIPVYKSIDYLIFETNLPAETLGVRINRSEKELLSYEYKMIQRATYQKYVLRMPKLEAGVYEIAIFNLTTKTKIKDTEFVIGIDPILSHNLLKLDDTHYCVDITSSYFSTTLSKDINVREFDDFEISFFYNQNRFTYDIPFMIPMYKIDTNPWCPLTDYIWIDDIRYESSIQFYGIDCIEEAFRVVHGAELLESVDLLKDGAKYISSIGFLRTFKANYDYVNIIWLNSKKTMDGVICYNKCILNEDKTRIEYDPKNNVLQISLRFVGKGSLGVRLINNEGLEVYNQNGIQNKQMLAIYNVQTFTPYTIEIYEKTRGFALKKVRILKQYVRKFYSYEDLVGMEFKITNLIYDVEENGKLMRKTDELPNTFVEITKKINEHQYLGKLKKIFPRGVFNFYSVNPADIELISDFINDKVEIYISKNGEPLLYDFGMHSVRNCIGEKNAIEIFSFVMELNER